MTASTPADQPNSLRARLGSWIESSRVQGVIIALILLNALTLGLETSASVVAQWGPWLRVVDTVVLTVFVVELLTKLFAFGPRFFRDPWNVFDLVVVGIALIPASGPLSVLRALRILRVLRLVSLMPRLRFVVTALLAVIPGLGAIAGLLVLIFYVFAVIATNLFGPSFPDWFGTLGRSLLTLFEVMTLDNWSSGILRPVSEVYPWAWLYFVPFVLITAFTILNLFIALIVDTMQKLHAYEQAQTIAQVRDVAQEEAENITEAVREVADQENDALEAQIRELRRDIAQLRELMQR